MLWQIAKKHCKYNAKASLEIIMQAGFAPHTEQVNKEAREWLMLMESGDALEHEREALAVWLAASEKHRDAYQQIELIWSDLGTVANSPQGEALRAASLPSALEGAWGSLVSAARQFFNETVLGALPQAALAVASVAIVAGLFYVSQPEPAAFERYATQVGEIKTIQLDDGSEVTLGAKSAFKIRMSEGERRAELESGQAFFVVAKDASRPFFVDAGSTRVRVVGTQFDVRRNQGRTRVAVLEGVVNVSSSVVGASGAADPLVLRAGQQAIKPSDEVLRRLDDVSTTELGAWREGRLVYRNVDLIDVIADANRYFKGSISLQATELATLKVTVALRVDQVGFLPDMLAETLPIAVERQFGQRVVISGL